MVEMFAGVGRIAKLASWVGYRSRAVDVTYHPPKSPLKPKRGKFPRARMDINGAAGFANLAIKTKEFGKTLGPFKFTPSDL